MEALKQYDPELYELEMADQELDRKTNELSLNYRRASAEERKDLRKELEAALNKHFDVRQQRRKLQLARLEKELQRMRDEIEGRNDKRADIVGKRLHELVGDSADLDF